MLQTRNKRLYPARFNNTVVKLFKHKIKDIIDAILLIESFTSETQYEEFHKDAKTYSATIRQIEIICDATKLIPLHVRSAYGHIPFKEMEIFDYLLRHEGDNCRCPQGAYMDYIIIWNTVHDVLIPLIDPLNELYESLD